MSASLWIWSLLAGGVPALLLVAALVTRAPCLVT